MGIAKQIKGIHAPIGRLTAKYRSTVYYLNGNELVRSKEFLEVGVQVNVYAIHDGIGDIGEGRFIKEVDQTHFGITYGKLRILGDKVQACSKNGVVLRPLLKGSEYNVVAVKEIADDLALYSINDLEYLSSADEIEYIMGYFLPLEDTQSFVEKKIITHAKGIELAYKSVKGELIQLLDNSWLNTITVKGQIS